MKEISRFTEIDVTNPAPLFAGFDLLETWVLEHYSTNELVRFNLDIEF